MASSYSSFIFVVVSSRLVMCVLLVSWLACIAYSDFAHGGDVGGNAK
jgi:hypothetical protein